MKPKESKFKGKVNKDAKKQQTQGSSYGYLNLPKGINVFSPEPGSKVKFDIIPYTVTDEKHPDRDSQSEIAVVGELWYKRPFRVHRNIGVNKDSVVCPTSIGKKCPICEYRAKRVKEGAEKEELDALKASMRNLYIIIPIEHEKLEEKPHIWDSSQFLFQNLLNNELEENEDYAVFPDLEQGLTLRVRFISKTIGSSKPFAEASRIDFLERNEQYDSSILKTIPNLDKILTILPSSEIESMFFELDDVQEKEEEAEEKPIRKKKVVEDEEEDEKPIRKKKAIQEDEEEDDDEDYADDDNGKAGTIKKSTIKESNKPTKKPKLTWEDVSDMEEAEMEEVADKYGFELEYENEEEMRKKLAEYLGIEIPKKSKKAKLEEEENNEEKENDKPSLKELKLMDEDELLEVCDNYPGLKINPDNYANVSLLRKAIIAKFGYNDSKSEEKAEGFKRGLKKAKEEVVDDDDDEEETKPVSKTKKPVSKGGCPHGHTFGKDCDEFDECEDCTKWDQCIEAK